MDKRYAILNSVLNTASVLKTISAELPKTGKKRNIFIKNYNRRPMNKQKRAKCLSNMAIVSCMGAAQISTIISQPVPKFEVGGLINKH